VFTIRQPRRSARASLLGLTLSILLAGMLVGSPVASANSVRCKGTVTPKAAKSLDMDYAFFCSEEIKGFSVVSNMSLTEFGVTADVLDPASKNPVPGQEMSCEGSFPGDGFGCAGKAETPNLIGGTFSTEEQPCAAGKSVLRTWVVAVDTAGKASGPMELKPPKCPKPPKKKKTKKH
jgi:hypothetical protein